MTIAVGEKIPESTLKEKTEAGIQDVDTDALFSGKTVVMIGVPGAYTPTCTKEHLPSYVEKAGELRAKGVDDILCISVNDPFVMEAWGVDAAATGKVRLLADWDGSFTHAMGLAFDGSGAGLGSRSKRFSMVVKNGTVESLDIEENPGAMVVTGAATCLTRI